MKTNKNSSRLAFSLIELSVVILVIGILVIGITQGSRIITESKMKSAIALTKGSPVNSTEGLVLWLDSTNKESIATGTAGSGVYGVAGDNDDVTNWKSQNPQTTNQNQIIVSAITASRPKYLNSGIGSLPTLSFDGNGDYLDSTTAPMKAGIQQFTYIAVWQIPTSGTSRAIFEQNCNAASCTEIRASLLADAGGTYGFIGNNNDYKVVPYQLKKPMISAMIVSSNTTNIKIYHNSITMGYQGSGNGTNPNRVISNNIFVVGANGYSTKSEFFNGYISEIIIFERALKNSEVQPIIQYLSTKYGIKLS